MIRIGRRFVPQSTIDRRVQACDDRHAATLRTKTSRLTGTPIPLCACGKCVYTEGQCYNCYAERAR